MTRIRKTLIGILAAAATLSGAAADPLWIMERDESALEFVIDLGGSEIVGAFADWTAEIDFDPAIPGNASLRVEINMQSVSVDDPRAQALGDTTWLSVEDHPTAVFEAAGFDWSPDTGALDVNGTLTLRDIAAPLVLSGTLNVADGRGEADITGVILRLTHDVGIGQDAVGAEVLLRARVVAAAEN